MKTDIQKCREFIENLELKFTKAHDRIEKYINKHPKGLDANTKTLAKLQAAARDIRSDIEFNRFVILPQLEEMSQS